MKRRLVGLFVVGVVAAACGGPLVTSTTVTFTTAAPTSTTVTTPTTTAPSEVDLSAVRVLADVRHDEEPSYVVDVSVPRLDGLDDAAVQEAVNKLLAAGIGAGVDAFVTQAAGTEMVEGIPSEFDVSYTVTLLEAGLFSVLVDSYEYVSGAAHGFTAVDGYVFDLASGARLGVDDVTTSRDRLRDLIRQAVADQEYGGYRASVDEFTSGQDLLDLAAFALDPDGLIVAFDQYDVAAGAAGVVTVHLDYDLLRGLVPEESPVARMAGG